MLWAADRGMVVVDEVKGDNDWERKRASERARNSVAKGVGGGEREKEKGREREAAMGQVVGADRDEFVSFHAGKLSRSPRPMIYWATMW